jgi:hypothetical protein
MIKRFKTYETQLSFDFDKERVMKVKIMDIYDKFGDLDKVIYYLNENFTLEEVHFYGKEHPVDRHNIRLFVDEKIIPISFEKTKDKEVGSTHLIKYPIRINYKSRYGTIRERFLNLDDILIKPTSVISENDPYGEEDWIEDLLESHLDIDPLGEDNWDGNEEISEINIDTEINIGDIIYDWDGVYMGEIKEIRDPEYYKTIKYFISQGRWIEKWELVEFDFKLQKKKLNESHLDVDSFSEEDWNEIEEKGPFDIGDIVTCIDGHNMGPKYLQKGYDYVVLDVYKPHGFKTYYINVEPVKKNNKFDIDRGWHPELFIKKLNESNDKWWVLGKKIDDVDNWEYGPTYKVGDKLKCIRQIGGLHFYVGKTYEVIELSKLHPDHYLYVRNDANARVIFHYGNIGNYFTKIINESHLDVDPYSEEDWNDVEIPIGECEILMLKDQETPAYRYNWNNQDQDFYVYYHGGNYLHLNRNQKYIINITEQKGDYIEFTFDKFKTAGEMEFYEIPISSFTILNVINENKEEVDPYNEEDWDDIDYDNFKIGDKVKWLATPNSYFNNKDIYEIENKYVNDEGVLMIKIKNKDHYWYDGGYTDPRFTKRINENHSDVDPFEEENWKYNYIPKGKDEKVIDWLRKIGLDEDEIKDLFKEYELYYNKENSPYDIAYDRFRKYVDTLADKLDLYGSILTDGNPRLQFLTDIFGSLYRLYVNNHWLYLKGGRYIDKPEMFKESVYSEVDPYGEDDWDDDEEFFYIMYSPFIVGFGQCKPMIHVVLHMHYNGVASRRYIWEVDKRSPNKGKVPTCQTNYDDRWHRRATEEEIEKYLDKEKLDKTLNYMKPNVN